MNSKKVNLSNLGGGELAELANRELTRICENIADPNSRTDATRKLSISIAVKPDKKGQTAEITYKVESKIPGPEPAKTTAFIAMDKETREISLYGMDIRQQDMFKPEPMITEIKPVSEAKVAPGPQPGALAPPLNTN